MSARFFTLPLAIALWLGGAGAAARSPLGTVAADLGGAKRPALLGPARSLGSPTDGSLEGGVELKAGPALKLRRSTGPRWGLPELVALVERAARQVSKRHPGSVLLVGDLSRKQGGELGRHQSHESGRDADVGFYFVDRQRQPVESDRFLQVRWDGRAVDAPELEFDDQRNWLLVQSFVTDPGTRVQHIFVAEPVRKRLLAHARRIGVYLPVLHRAAMAMKQPRRGLPHDDHFHVRIACPHGQHGPCRAEPRPLSKEPAAALGVRRRVGRDGLAQRR